MLASLDPSVFAPTSLGGVPGDDRLDLLRRHVELDREVDVFGAVEVDEGVDPVGRRLEDPLHLALAVGDRGDALLAQPVVVVLGGEPDDVGAVHPQQLDRERADPARGAGDDDRVALRDVDRAHRGEGGDADHVERARLGPADVGRFADQLFGGDDALARRGSSAPRSSRAPRRRARSRRRRCRPPSRPRPGPSPRRRGRSTAISPPGGPCGSTPRRG